jgi:hypothetical protein
VRCDLGFGIGIWGGRSLDLARGGGRTTRQTWWSSRGGVEADSRGPFERVLSVCVLLLLPVGHNCYAVPDSADGRLSGIAR